MLNVNIIIIWMISTQIYFQEIYTMQVLQYSTVQK